ncbi:hypothetical protein BDW74DRAFT_111140 [Aspergillus multicolor]|uniref:uncharacterized protein n=1 Tax=Aspergillus multicolor TaxID=41759 RepID=UPI003CCCDBAC
MAILSAFVAIMASGRFQFAFSNYTHIYSSVLSVKIPLVLITSANTNLPELNKNRLKLELTGCLTQESKSCRLISWSYLFKI